MKFSAVYLISLIFVVALSSAQPTEEKVLKEKKDVKPEEPVRKVTLNQALLIIDRLNDLELKTPIQKKFRDWFTTTVEDGLNRRCTQCFRVRFPFSFLLFF